jgi:hypothetical protein
MRLAELKEAVDEAYARAAFLLDSGQDHLATELYTTVFEMLHAQCTFPPAQAPGWPQVAGVVTHPGNRLVLDALDATHARQLHTRAATLLDLPEVTWLTCLDDIHVPIRIALAITLARRQAGDFRGACTMHWATGSTLLAAQVSSAFAGYAKALRPIREALEAEPPRYVLAEPEISFYAFTLRVAFQKALAVAG